jgi:uncharacterized iron-regulated membrane protein
MQFLWAALDVITIFVLGSGLYLWLKRGAPAPARADNSVAPVGREDNAPVLATEGEPQ